METFEILHALREAKAQILHLQEMYNDMCDHAFDTDREHENLGTTNDTLKIIDTAINRLQNGSYKNQ